MRIIFKSKSCENLIIRILFQKYGRKIEIVLVKRKIIENILFFQLSARNEGGTPHALLVKLAVHLKPHANSVQLLWLKKYLKRTKMCRYRCKMTNLESKSRLKDVNLKILTINYYGVVDAHLLFFLGQPVQLQSWGNHFHEVAVVRFHLVNWILSENNSMSPYSFDWAVSSIRLTVWFFFFVHDVLWWEQCCCAFFVPSHEKSV